MIHTRVVFLALIAVFAAVGSFAQVGTNNSVLNPNLASADELQEIGIKPPERDVLLYKAAGCAVCKHTGYRGRMGIFEIFAIDEEIEQMIYENCSLVELRDKARDLGMRTLREDGVRMVLAGQTTINEVLQTTVA